MKSVDYKKNLTDESRVFFSWSNHENLPVLSVSDNVQKLLGFAPEEFTTGKHTYLSLIHFQDQARLLAEIDSAKSKKLEECTLTPYKIRNAQGHYLYVSSSIQFIKNDNDNVEEFRGYIQSSTHSSESNKLLNLVLSSTHLGLWEWSVDEQTIPITLNGSKILLS